MPKSYDLDRFIQAQAPVIGQVRRELADGRKRSHWMWFVFPQLAGLGHSPMARRYAIASLDEAHAYLQHPVLGPRLVECSELVNSIEHGSITAIFGTPDDLKLHSSMTLFSMVPSAPSVFGEAVKKYFAGVPDRLTVSLLATQRPVR